MISLLGYLVGTSISTLTSWFPTQEVLPLTHIQNPHFTTSLSSALIPAVTTSDYCSSPLTGLLTSTHAQLSKKIDRWLRVWHSTQTNPPIFLYITLSKRKKPSTYLTTLLLAQSTLVPLSLRVPHMKHIPTSGPLHMLKTPFHSSSCTN